LTGKDDLAADNQASIVSLLPTPVKVRWFRAGTDFGEAFRAVAEWNWPPPSELDDYRVGFDFVGWTT